MILRGLFQGFMGGEGPLRRLHESRAGASHNVCSKDRNHTRSPVRPPSSPVVHSGAIPVKAAAALIHFCARKLTGPGRAGTLLEPGELEPGTSSRSELGQSLCTRSRSGGRVVPKHKKEAGRCHSATGLRCQGKHPEGTCTKQNNGDASRLAVRTLSAGAGLVLLANGYLLVWN